MSAHVLLNSSNELGKEIKCEACLAFYLFRNEFNKFNNTGTNVRFYLSYDVKITLKLHFRRYNFCHCVRNVVMDVITFPVNL